ncbi:BZ3500_MvSof-1268-A1-R1_Chr11-3g03550 [Microbotryum saponariae]|uniref:BZ3500_MvSof-1268-A1-R1_Chr11-3g03550 protein n=1 Tax=Microbotryum saponariae TaxID=289078 RepID=A0A2X0LCU9_9BASI|nr:BZ3500_MvSof-1268-A1-R1_Chr11-3g03550 [Microbotryum saponariae]SDA03559.1 BZ3501_MvSof-1269-A2-R1_Chr11g03127 [Microbotryum saponariae]
MVKPTIDYSLYYVTGRELLPPSSNPDDVDVDPTPSYLTHLELALRGGVTVVQIREKDVGGRELYQVAKRSKEVCDQYSVPLIINDRLDIALLLSCGLHVGQSDLPAPQARQFLGPDQLLGVSINTVEELEVVLAYPEGTVDYIGVGPCYGTKTKKDLSPVLGMRGVRDLLARLGGSEIKVVVIGGVTPETIPNILYQTPAAIPDSNEYRHLDGLAVVSSIAASPDPDQAARSLLSQFRTSPRFTLTLPTPLQSTPTLLDQVINLFTRLQSTSEEHRTLVHHLTNQVVMNDCANLTLALGCSPIMSVVPQELDQLAGYLGCLLLNLGTATLDQVSAQRQAGRAANRVGKLVVFDPVGCGATVHRRGMADQLMDDVRVSVCKGNAGEIGSLLGSKEVKSRGVDSVGKGFADPASVVRDLARREKFTVAMSGEVDYISNGEVVVKLSNGHDYQGIITGSGCMASTAVACFASLPLEKDETIASRAFLAAVTGITAINVAAEIAAQRKDVMGPNTFRAAMIDECWSLTADKLRQGAKFQVL